MTNAKPIINPFLFPSIFTDIAPLVPVALAFGVTAVVGPVPVATQLSLAQA